MDTDGQLAAFDCAPSGLVPRLQFNDTLCNNNDNRFPVFLDCSEPTTCCAKCDYFSIPSLSWTLANR